jgi:hypothetical protein
MSLYAYPTQKTHPRGRSTANAPPATVIDPASKPRKRSITVSEPHDCAPRQRAGLESAFSALADGCGRQAGGFAKTRCAPRRRAKNNSLSRLGARDAPSLFLFQPRDQNSGLKSRCRVFRAERARRMFGRPQRVIQWVCACDPQSEGTVGRGVREGRAGGRWRGVPLGARSAMESGVAWAARLGSACRGVR